MAKACRSSSLGFTLFIHQRICLHLCLHTKVWVAFKGIQKGHGLHRLFCKGEEDGQGRKNTLNIASQRFKAMTLHKRPARWTPGRRNGPPEGPYTLGDDSHRAALPAVVTLHSCVRLAAPLVDSNSIHSGSVMLMLLTVVFVGVAAFFIYKFKR